MAKKPNTAKQNQFTVCVQYVPTPNAKERFSQAINILLSSAARNAPQPKQISSSMGEKPASIAAIEDIGGHGINGGHDHEE